MPGITQEACEGGSGTYPYQVRILEKDATPVRSDYSGRILRHVRARNSFWRLQPGVPAGVSRSPLRFFRVLACRIQTIPKVLGQRVQVQTLWNFGFRRTARERESVCADHRNSPGE